MTDAITDQSPAIELRQLAKAYGSGDDQVIALDGVSLSVQAGEFVCLVGASGCGKSTLLNMLVGLDQPNTGSVEVNGRSTLMFQESALFPWLTVGANIEMALKLRGTPRRDRPNRINELLSSVQLDGQTKKRPHELSGGMRQRVAIARAFAQDVDVLCMDEPFGALDAMTRDLLHDELERLWIERNLTVVFVTHNVREAVRLADRVVLLSSRPGRVLDTFSIDIDRPRRIDTPEVSRIAATVTDRLRHEVRSHVHDR